MAEGGQMVRFFSEMRTHAAKSLAENRPVQEKKVFIEIMTPGALDPIFTRPIFPHDQSVYPVEWARYMNGEKEEENITGWRIEDWPAMDRAQVDHLRSLRFFTVEQVAQASDANIQRIMGGVQLRLRAQAALKSKDDTKVAEQMAVQNQALLDQMKLMQEQIDAMKADQPEKRGPGRPRKEDVAA